MLTAWQAAKPPGLSDTGHPAPASLGDSDPLMVLIWVLPHLVPLCNRCCSVCLCLFFQGQSSPACSSWHACCTPAWHSLQTVGSKPGPVHLPLPSPHKRKCDPPPLAIQGIVTQHTWARRSLALLWARMCALVRTGWQRTESARPCRFEPQVTTKHLYDVKKSCNLFGPHFPHLYHRDDSIKPQHKAMGGGKRGQSCKCKGAWLRS